MIYLKSADGFDDRTFEGGIVLDLSDVVSGQDMASRIALTPKAKEAAEFSPNRFDPFGGLRDRVSEWVEENAMKRVYVFLLNCDILLEIRRHLLTELALVLDDALMIGVVELHQQNQEFYIYTGLNNINIYLLVDQL